MDGKKTIEGGYFVRLSSGAWKRKLLNKEKIVVKMISSESTPERIEG